MPIGESLARYVVSLVRATRHNSGTRADFVKKYVNYGASVRAAQFIVLAAKARALAAAATTSPTRTSPRWRFPCCATAFC